MSALPAGLPVEVRGSTVNRRCGSGLDALGTAARATRSGDTDLLIAGGVESIGRVPIVMPKAESAFSRNNRVEDTTIGWCFVNKLMKERYGVDSMPETAESVATDFNIEREAQDRMALASQRKALAAQQSGFSTPRSCRSRPPAEEGRCDRRREGRASSRNQPRNLGQAQGRGAPARQRDGGQPIGCERRRLRVAARRRERRDPAWTRAGSARGCDGQRRRAARIMGMGPAAATRKVLTLAGLTLEQLDVIELNEAFAAQGAKAAAPSTPSTPATCASDLRQLKCVRRDRCVLLDAAAAPTAWCSEGSGRWRTVAEVLATRR